MRRYKPSYFIKQAFKGMFRNGMMSAASVVVLLACLTVLGVFTMLVSNINYNLSQLDNLNEIIAFSDSTAEYKEGDSFTVAGAVITTDGRVSLGWSTENGTTDVRFENGREATVSASDSSGGVITLYPVWDEILKYDNYVVRYHSSGIKINGSLPEDEKEYLAGEIFTLPETLSAKNSAISFLGWSTLPNSVDPEFQGGESFSVTSETAHGGIINLYAVWSEMPSFATFSIVYDCGRESVTSLPSDYSVRLDAVKKAINALPGIEPGSVRFVSREETMKNEIEGMSDYEGLADFFKNADNPYPDTFIITYGESSQVQELEKLISSIKDVYKTRCRSDIAESINSLKSGVSTVFLWFSVILLAVSVLVIVNTVKLAVEYRSKEIVIMRYIGATKAFIALPFELEGAILGLFSGIISFVIQWIAYGHVAKLVRSSIEMISILPFSSVWQMLLPECLVIGAATGFVGSLIAIWKYLKA